MSTVECFFSNKYAGRSDLFEGLSIWEAGSAAGGSSYRELQGTFPVIFLSFANIKATKYADMVYKITKVIADLYNSNDCLAAGDLLNENEKIDVIQLGGKIYKNTLSVRGEMAAPSSKTYAARRYSSARTASTTRRASHVRRWRRRALPTT